MIKCFVIDNQPLIVKTLESYINKTPLFKLLGTARSYQAYADLTVTADILLVNNENEALNDSQLAILRERSQVLIFMAKAGNRQVSTMKSRGKCEYTGYLELPVTYNLFMEEIGRLIK